VNFGTFLVVVQLVLGAVIGVIAAALAIAGGSEGLVAVLTAGSTALVLFGLITATAIRPVAQEARHDH
jgi:hypothetical protein